MSAARIQVSLWDKPVLSRTEAESLCPGQGRTCLDDFIKAGWIKPLNERVHFSASKLRECLDRLLAGEDPRKSPNYPSR